MASSVDVVGNFDLSEIDSEFDALIVFGYGPVLPGGSPGAGRLNMFGRLNALAAGMLYRGRDISTVIPTGGRTGGPHLPSEARLIAELARARFGIPTSAFWLEETSTDTITNLVFVANVLDGMPQRPDTLLFVCMGFHLPRVREICSLVKLEGSFVTAESVVSTRSSHHGALLRKLLDPERESYTRILDEQALWLTWLSEMPEIWLPEMAKIDDPERLAGILRMERVDHLMRQRGIDVASESPAELRVLLSSIRRPDGTT